GCSPPGLVPGRKGRPEAELGPGREALGVGDRDAGPPQRPLPDAGDVPVAGEADPAPLGEAEAAPGCGAGAGHGRAPPSGREAPGRRVGRRVTGTMPGRWPVARSWPVPWLP